MKIAMRKTLGGKLEPVGDAGAGVLARIPHGDIVLVDVHRPRNVAHFRKYWALVSLIYGNQTRYRSPEELNDALKVHCGHCMVMQLRDGTEVRVPKSISFSAMTQDEFEIFYARVIDVVCQEIVPGLKREDLARELLEFAA